MDVSKKKVALVTNIPSPYRIPIYKLVSQNIPFFHVFFCAEKEPNRKWKLNLDGFNFTILRKGILFSKKDGFNYVHVNWDIIKKLYHFNPDVVITTGYNPTLLFAFIYTVIFRKKHIVMSDGWINSENHLSKLHKIVRIIVFKFSSAFIGASNGTFSLFRSYGVTEEQMFKSHLCIDNNRFANKNGFKNRKYDLMYAGNIQDVKMPLFFVKIAENVSKQLPNLKVLIIGDGPMKEQMFDALKNCDVEFEYAGFVTQEQLPLYYSNSKLLLFTTKNDVWGIVCNEALASGTPVVSSQNTAVAEDLLLDNMNGFVVEGINSEEWGCKVIKILKDQSFWNVLSLNASLSVREYNYANAAKGICDAIDYAICDLT